MVSAKQMRRNQLDGHPVPWTLGLIHQTSSSFPSVLDSDSRLKSLEEPTAEADQVRWHRSPWDKVVNSSSKIIQLLFPTLAPIIAQNENRNVVFEWLADHASLIVHVGIRRNRVDNKEGWWYPSSSSSSTAAAVSQSDTTSISSTVSKLMSLSQWHMKSSRVFPPLKVINIIWFRVEIATTTPPFSRKSFTALSFQWCSAPKFPKSDPPILVLARAHFLLQHGEFVLPPHHVFYSNSDRIIMWCKTGRWSMLQAPIF